MLQEQNCAKQIPLIVVSPFALSAAALKALLETSIQHHVLGTCSGVALSLEAFKTDVSRIGERCILILVELESEGDVQVIARLLANAQAENHSCRIVVFTGSANENLHDAAVNAGASGLVRKTESAATLFKALACVAEGELWLDRATTGRIFQMLSRRKYSPEHDPELKKIATLTRKERAIVSEIGGMPSANGQELASRLHISEHTLRNHLSAIYAKLEVANRTDLYAYAREHGIKALAPRPDR